MPTSVELLQNSIVSWDTIKGNFDKPDLLLGNGFTLQFSGSFSYHSLFTIFLARCSPVHQELFTQFKTTNFEIIQEYLSYGRDINTILGLSTVEIDDAINQLKHGLIEAIETIHPRATDIDFNLLQHIAIQLHEFGDIFTTNYDLYLYHIVMQSLDISAIEDGELGHIPNYIPYQDYFWGNRAPIGFKQFMDTQNRQLKNIFYLHGSLFIFKDAVDNLKLKKDRSSNELIDKISNEIVNNKFPVFITEGTAPMKKHGIVNDPYLSFCLDNLENSDKSIVIFGNTLGAIDNHILVSLKKKPKDIIYCLYIGNKDLNQILFEKHDFLSKFNSYPNPIYFVDSSTVFNLNP